MEAPARPGDDEERYAVQSTWRLVVPAAIAFGLVGLAAFDGGVARWLCGVGAGLVALLWLVGRVTRPELIVEEGGYRVEERGRVRLRVAWGEIVRARAVPAEQAMYLDCGDAARNLLLPPRRGFGFRFARQHALYVKLAQALGDRLEIVAQLDPRPEPPPSSSDKPPRGGANGVSKHA